MAAIRELQTLKHVAAIRRVKDLSPEEKEALSLVAKGLRKVRDARGVDGLKALLDLAASEPVRAAALHLPGVKKAIIAGIRKEPVA